MFGTGDGEARTMFTSQDIGDIDGDGAPEFLDGWGKPIRCIRWPAGFVPSPADGRPRGSRADRDPFDPYRRDPTKFASARFGSLHYSYASSTERNNSATTSNCC